MEKFKKSIRTRLIVFGMYSILVVIFFILGIVLKFGDNEKAMALGFALGASIGIMMVGLYYIRKYILAIKNEQALKQLYIEENDERYKFIMAKTGGTAMNIVICGLFLGTVVSGLFHEVIFYTLLAATTFSTTVKGCLKLYYIKRV